MHWLFLIGLVISGAVTLFFTIKIGKLQQKIRALNRALCIFDQEISYLEADSTANPTEDYSNFLEKQRHTRAMTLDEAEDTMSKGRRYVVFAVISWIATIAFFVGFMNT